jgi:hypothetical protein
MNSQIHQLNPVRWKVRKSFFFLNKHVVK